MDSVTEKREDTPFAPGRQTWGGLFDASEPHVARGPFSRWPRTADAVLAVLVFATSLVAVAASALDDGEEFGIGAVSDLPVTAFILLGLAAGALLWRRRHPVPVTGFVLLMMICWAVRGHGDGQELAVVVAVYSVGRYADDDRQSVVTVGIALAISIIDTIIDSNQRVDIAPAIILAVLPWYIGRRVRNRGEYLDLLQERARRLEIEQHAEARQAVAEERARIARELHDVVAHRVSMMTVQAGAAKTVARADLDAAIDAMGDVELAGRQALGELRHLLGVLRPDTADPNDLGPQPGLAAIENLAAELTQTGADVSLAIADLPGDLPVAVELSAYRIVQESLTNVVKHAGPSPTVDVTIGSDGPSLVIEITNTCATAPPVLPVSGYGITGMRERAQLLGGTLSAERPAKDRFRVEARLPMRPGTT